MGAIFYIVSRWSDVDRFIALADFPKIVRILAIVVFKMYLQILWYSFFQKLESNYPPLECGLDLMSHF